MIVVIIHQAATVSRQAK